MVGWRVGFAVGNPDMIGALAKLKSYLDYGTLQPIQIASIITFDEGDEFVEEVNDVCRQRRDTLVDGLNRAGWKTAKPQGTMFVWAEIPGPYLDMDSMPFSIMMLRKAKVAVSPGIGFGPSGDRHVRFASLRTRTESRKLCEGSGKRCTRFERKPAAVAGPGPGGDRRWGSAPVTVEQSCKSYKPDMGFAVLFPGQGSQFVGMGADVFRARPDLFGESADEILGWSLVSLCTDGPEEELMRTDRAQPALFAVTYALWEALDAATPDRPHGAAGHSLGEYSALAAAGAFDFVTGLRLVAARGKAMQSTANGSPSGMAALIGADEALASEIAADRREAGGALWVANVNAPSQVVLAGKQDDIRWLIANARDLGARRAIALKVASGFHSPLMDEAAAELSSALDAVAFGELEFPVWANHSAESSGHVPTNLRFQLSNTVRFSDSLSAMRAAGIDTFVHIGPGDVTAGMARRTVTDAQVYTVSTLDDIPDVAAALTVQ